MSINHVRIAQGKIPTYPIQFCGGVSPKSDWLQSKEKDNPFFDDDVGWIQYLEAYTSGKG